MAALAQKPFAKRQPFDVPVLLVAKRPDLPSMPFRMGHECHLSQEAAANLDTLSKKLRRLLKETVSGENVERFVGAPARVQQGMAQGAAVPCLVQIMQAEKTPVRQVLVEVLGKIEDKCTTEALGHGPSRT